MWILQNGGEHSPLVLAQQATQERPCVTALSSLGNVGRHSLEQRVEDDVGLVLVQQGDEEQVDANGEEREKDHLRVFVQQLIPMHHLFSLSYSLIVTSHSH